MSRKRELIVKAILSYVDLQGLKQSLKFSNFPPDYLPLGTDLRDITFDLVEKADKDRLLPKLAAGLQKIMPNPVFHAELDDALGIDPAAPNRRPRWYSDPMPLRQPMADRELLRDMLFHMLENEKETRRLFMVHGPYPGKSHCRWLIKHVAAEAGFEEPIIIDLLEDVRSVTELAHYLVDRMGLEYSRFEARFSTEIREGKAFNNWFVGESLKFGVDRRWLLVFDSVAKEGIPTDLRHVVLDLGKKALERDFKNVWVMLLDCPVDETLELDYPGQFFEEPVQPIAKQEIEKILAWILEVRKLAGDINPKVPPTISTTLESASFPLNPPALKKLSRDIAGWWNRPPA